MANLNTKMIALVLAAGLVSGCGGGGGSSSGGGYIPPVDGGDAGGSDDEVAEQPIDYGNLNWSVLLDGTVLGLSYSTGDIKKSIIENGFAEFYDEDTVRIYLGDALITEDTGREVLSPTDIQNGAGASNPDFLANLAEVLAAADEDGRIDNGIIIGEEARAVVKGDINFDMPYSQFVLDNSDLLASLRASTSHNTSGLLGEKEAKKWMEMLEEGSSSAFRDFEGAYLLFYGDGQYMANIELDHGGTGIFRGYSSVTPKFTGVSSVSDIESWTTDVEGSTLNYTKGPIDNSCYALRKDRGLISAVCSDNIGMRPTLTFFLKNMKLGTNSAELELDAIANGYKRYVRLGSIMSSIPFGSHEPAENLKASDMFLNADHTAEYDGVVGTWGASSLSASSVDVTDGVTSRIINLESQIGAFAFRFREFNDDGIDSGKAGSQVIVAADQKLYLEDLKGATFTPFHYYGGVVLETTSFSSTDSSTNKP